MILLIDHYDSFVHNLARYVRELGHEAVVRRHDAVTVGEVEALAPTQIILSPGPCSPAEAPVSVDVIRRLGPTIPLLGVCLGHQCIGAAYDADIVRAGRPVHGRTSLIAHDGTGIFAGLPTPFRAARYHSLVIARATLPASLRVTASSADDGEIMAVQHESFPVTGVQFHPESAASQYGYAMLDWFLQTDHVRRDGLPTGADGVDGVESALRAREASTAAIAPWGPPADGEPPVFVPPPVHLVR